MIIQLVVQAAGQLLLISADPELLNPFSEVALASPLSAERVGEPG